jgi:hypothetical protein
VPTVSAIQLSNGEVQVSTNNSSDTVSIDHVLINNQPFTVVNSPNGGFSFNGDGDHHDGKEAAAWLSAARSPCFGQPARAEASAPARAGCTFSSKVDPSGVRAGQAS